MTNPKDAIKHLIVLMLENRSFDHMFGFMTTCTGSKFPTAYGLFGGYGAPSYPLCKIKGVNAFEILKDLPEDQWTVEGLMNGQPFKGAKYTTHHMGMQFEIAKQGELYMICQGAGGGYGDPLERDPEAVVTDLRDNTFFAVIHLQVGETEYQVDSRPSDAIALALRVTAPIYVDEDVVRKARTLEATKEAAEPAVKGEEPTPEKLKEWLQNIKPEDFEKFNKT